MPLFEVIGHRRVPVRQLIKAPNKRQARMKAALNEKGWIEVDDSGDFPIEIVYVEEPLQETE